MSGVQPRTDGHTPLNRARPVCLSVEPLPFRNRTKETVLTPETRGRHLTDLSSGPTLSITSGPAWARDTGERVLRPIGSHDRSPNLMSALRRLQTIPPRYECVRTGPQPNKRSPMVRKTDTDPRESGFSLLTSRFLRLPSQPLQYPGPHSSRLPSESLKTWRYGIENQVSRYRYGCRLLQTHAGHHHLRLQPSLCEVSCDSGTSLLRQAHRCGFSQLRPHH